MNGIEKGRRLGGAAYTEGYEWYHQPQFACIKKWNWTGDRYRFSTLQNQVNNASELHIGVWHIEVAAHSRTGETDTRYVWLH